MISTLKKKTNFLAALFSLSGSAYFMLSPSGCKPNAWAHLKGQVSLILTPFQPGFQTNYLNLQVLGFSSANNQRYKTTMHL